MCRNRILGCDILTYYNFGLCTFVHNSVRNRSSNFNELCTQVVSRRTFNVNIPRHTVALMSSSFFVREVTNWNSLPAFKLAIHLKGMSSRPISEDMSTVRVQWRIKYRCGVTLTIYTSGKLLEIWKRGSISTFTKLLFIKDTPFVFRKYYSLCDRIFFR